MSETNILAAIPGQHIASAGHALPDPVRSSVDEMETTEEVPGHGMVTFTWQRMAHKRGRSTHIWWVAKHARPADSP